MEQSPKLDHLVKRVEESRAEIKRLERQIEEDRQTINEEVEHLFPNSRKGLTLRQSQILQLVRDGKANKEIADVCNISVRTVKFHVSCLLAIFGKTSRHELLDLSDKVEAITEGK